MLNIIKGFHALIQEFPGSEGIIIEVGGTFFQPEELIDSLFQREFDDRQTGRNITKELSLMKKITMKIKEWTPLLRAISTQIKSSEKRDETDNREAYIEDDMLEKYRQALDDALALIRSEYDGNLIICYHPTVAISNDGLGINYAKTTPIFQEVCEKNNIIFVDTSEAFLKAYKEDYSVPYGFWNTSMGSGHLNVNGHRIIAQELYKILSELKTETEGVKQ